MAFVVAILLGVLIVVIGEYAVGKLGIRSGCGCAK